MKLNAVEVLFLHYVKGKTEKEALQHDFWLIEYNRDPQHLLNQLINTGAVYQSYDLSVTLTKFTVPIIKDLLKNSGIKVSGNKKELITRVKEHQEFIDVTALDINGIYIVDKSLETFLHDTVFINYISLHGPISIEEAYSYYTEHPYMNASEIIIALHELKIASNIKKPNKYDAVKCHHLLSEYYSSELHDTEQSLYHLNQFSMLIVLESINRYKQLDSKMKHDEFFNIDNYTIEKYRNLLLMKQFNINELYDKFLVHTKDLPYSETDITLAAQFIIRYIIGSEQTEAKLIDHLNNSSST
ncbi:MAG: SAP domain-containing protein [Jeotgalicoccus sp.]